MWNKISKGDVNGTELSKLIRDIQCVALIISLAIVTNILTEEHAPTIVETKIEIFEQSRVL